MSDVRHIFINGLHALKKDQEKIVWPLMYLIQLTQTVSKSMTKPKSLNPQILNTSTTSIIMSLLQLPLDVVYKLGYFQNHNLYKHMQHQNLGTLFTMTDPHDRLIPETTRTVKA